MVDPLDKIAGMKQAGKIPTASDPADADIEAHLGESAKGHDKLSEADRAAREAIFRRADLIMKLANEGLVPALDGVLAATTLFVSGKDALAPNPDRDTRLTGDLSDEMARLDRALAEPVGKLFVMLFEAGDIPPATIDSIMKIYAKKNGGAEKK